MRLRGGGITRSITVRAIAQRRRRRAHVQDQPPADREDRGRPPRRRPPRPAVLPAQARRQVGHPPRAPPRLTVRPRRLAPAAARSSRDRRPTCAAVGYLAADGADRPDPPLRAPPLERRPDAHRRRRRGRRRAQQRTGRRGARCIMRPDCKRIPGVRDSKTLSAAQRERLAKNIRRRARRSGSARPRCAEIDRLNIYHATHLAMRAGDPARWASTTTSSSTGATSAASRSRSGRTPRSSTATRGATRSPARRSSPRSCATG